MKANQLRVGNFIESKWGHLEVEGIVKDNVTITNEYMVGGRITTTLDSINPILITDKWLMNFDFLKVRRESYVNGFEYLKQIVGNHDDIEKEGIDPNGIWFNGIGTHQWEEDESLAVNILCRGNYVCRSASYVHELQNLYFALTGEELKIK